MSQDLPPIDIHLPLREQVTHLASPSGLRIWLGRLWTLACAVWKWAFGALLTQTLLGAVVVMGWTLRWMQRTAHKTWWKLSPHYDRSTRFTGWLQVRNAAHPQAHWPNWIWRQQFTAIGRETEGQRWTVRLGAYLSGLTASLRQNLRLGLAAIFNVAVFTLPGCVLMLFSWYDGWNNSFNKGYEQAPVGPLTGLGGMFLFILAMLYVPMAQARQAATGQWRSFYDFALIWQLIRRARSGCLILALAYSLFSIPFSILKTAPYYLSTKNDVIAQFTAPEALSFLNRYFFWSGVGFFLAWITLRWLAARLYARTLLRGLQKGEVPVSQLSGAEREMLCDLDLIQIHPPRSRHVLVHVAAKTSATLLSATGVFLAGWIWFTYAAQIYITEFLNYHPVTGWLNQPLAQLPWFRYMPPSVQNPMGEFMLSLLFLMLAFGGAWTLLRVKAWFRKPHRVVTPA